MYADQGVKIRVELKHYVCLLDKCVCVCVFETLLIRLLIRGIGHNLHQI